MYAAKMAKERRPFAAEPLSPRSANIQMKPKTIQRKVVEQEAMKFSKPKDHASPPPDLVIQPPESPDGLTVQYHVGKELGKGGFAICYEGQRRGRHGGQTYALKVVKATMAQKKMEDKFRTELQIHAKMHHPNIVEFHKAFTFKENTYVVLELCPNGSIQEMVRNRRGISLPEVRRFVVQLCGAIKYMHARNVIHRDLKMGNLFLDKEMNVKIGDFGLAAVLVSPGEHEGSYTKAMSRRTTLCGTPNYIAPEILDKGKRGHDLKVDIWALGCIIYAMICCRPPFQANSSTEIYEKAKAVDYQWPEAKNIRSHVPEEVKNLVAALLRSDPTDRLSLDDTVNHPFFSMHGGDCIPAVLNHSCKADKPDWLSKSEPRGDVMSPGAPRLRLRDLAASCGVGSPDGRLESFDVVGGDVDLSLYKACLAEENAGTCPRVPLPDDIVYIGKTLPAARALIKKSAVPPVPQIPQALRNNVRNGPVIQLEDDKIGLGKPISLRKSAIVDSLTTLPSNGSRPAVARSSSQRGSNPAARGKPSGTGQQVAAESASMRVPQGLMHERPVRMTKTLPRNTSRVLRSQKTGLTREDAIPIHEDAARIMSPRLTKDQIIDQLSPNPDAKRREMALRGKARIAANLQNELNALTFEDKKPVKAARPARTQRPTKSVGWLAAPADHVERIHETTTSDVRTRLDLLQHELCRAYDSIGDDIKVPQIEQYDKAEGLREAPPLITKWVDYTNKLGVGYTLNDGTMGCLLKPNKIYDNPHCGVRVENTRDHYRNRIDPSYAEGAEIVPQQGPSVEFTELSDDGGMTRIIVPAARFKVASSSEDGGSKAQGSRDVHEMEKKRRVSVWSRFAEYMVQNLAVDPFTEAGTGPGPLLRFYQRLGNVSIWGFVDGTLQFNFPDHTKIILHGDGKWIDCYYLPPAMMKRLKSGRPLDQSMLDARKKLSYPPSTFLQLHRSNEAEGKVKGLREVVQANEVQLKIDFVKTVIDTWVQHGGLGKLGKDNYIKWDGFQAKKGLAWVSVGATDGDIYYKAPDGSG